LTTDVYHLLSLIIGPSQSLCEGYPPKITPKTPKPLQLISVNLVDNYNTK
jgi:hypothetical protein